MGSSGFNWKLADHPKLPKGKTVGLIVLDGWGEANPDQYNCIHVAETPVMDSFKKAGGEMLAELVGITLGPKGRNVVLQNKYGPPKIVHDGETVLKQIELEDPVENVGVKLVRQAGAKTNDLFRTLCAEYKLLGETRALSLEEEQILSCFPKEVKKEITSEVVSMSYRKQCELEEVCSVKKPFC